MPINAIILAAGLGVRMRPLTETIPKPLIAVSGRPLLDWNIKILVDSDIQNIVINVHHLAEQIRTYSKSIHYPRIILSDESEGLLDSGGGVKNALKHLGSDPFIVVNADSLWLDGPKPNIARLVEAWDATKMDIILMLASGPQVSGYSGMGDFIMSQNGQLTRRFENTVSPFIYTGLAMMKPELFLDTPKGPFSLNLIFDRAIKKKKLYGLRLDGLWMHVGTPNAIDEAERQLKQSIL